jgi:UDP-glucose 4-epimerase
MPTAIVAGANGAIGRHVVAHLHSLGWAVGGVGHGPSIWAGAAPISAWFAGDITPTTLDVLADQIGSVDLIINVAGGSSVGASLADPMADFERTVTTAVRISDWVRRRAPSARIVHASSAAVYGDKHDGEIDEAALTAPVSPYGHHKQLMESAARFWGATFGVRSAAVRLFSVYGSGLHKQLIYDLCGKLAASPGHVNLSGLPDATRDWMWIEDAAALLVTAGDLAGADSPIINGCTGEGRSVREMAELMVKAWGCNTVIEFDGVRRPGDPLHLVGSARRMLTTGFRPRVDLAEGLRRTVAARRLVQADA